MGFRLRALAWHLLASAGALTLILGTLYVGWYHWPGWYLADATQVVLVMVSVDVVAGPLLTFVVARAAKPRRDLARDIATIVAVQLIALIYGSVSLWNGRPLYYAFSESVLQLVQAYDINSTQADLGRRQNPDLAPHWYSLPRWIWAPLPKDPQERQKMVESAVSGGDDVISMPRYFQPWNAGLPELRLHLRKVDDVAYFGGADKTKLKERLRAAGYAIDRANSMTLTGRGQPLLAVFDPAGVKIESIFKAR
ncbi:MAG: hypothetical protein ABJC66_11475 [Gammaproteobacteria bacterium]